MSSKLGRKENHPKTSEGYEMGNRKWLALREEDKEKLGRRSGSRAPWTVTAGGGTGRLGVRGWQGAEDEVTGLRTDWAVRTGLCLPLVAEQRPPGHPGTPHTGLALRGGGGELPSWACDTGVRTPRLLC